MKNMYSLLMFVFLMSVCHCQAQDSLPLRKRHYDYNQIFSIGHTNFVLQFHVLPGVNTDFHQPFLGVSVKAAGGVQIGWMYQFNFPKCWGFQTGAQVGFDHDNCYLFMSNKYSGLGADYSMVYQGELTDVILPLYACYYVPFNDPHKSWLANFKLGTDLRYGGATGDFTWLDQSGNTLASILASNGHTNPNGKFFVSFHASAGVNYILPNKRMLNFQIIGNWSPLFRNTYHYSFMPGTTKELDGSYTRGFDYIAFELNYILTSPYRMKKKK